MRLNAAQSTHCLPELLIFSLPYETISSLRAEIHSNHFCKSVFNTTPGTYQHSKKFFWMIERVLTFHYNLMKLQNTDMSLNPNKLAYYLLERKKLQSRYVVHRMATYDKTKEVHRNCISRKRIARQAGLTQQAWVAQTLHIPKKGLSSGLAPGLALGNELWALEIFSLIRMLQACVTEPQ